MDIGEIISESIRYPISDMDNIKYPLIVFALLAVPILLMSIALFVRSDSLGTISVFLTFIGLIAFILIAPGYLISVMREGINRTGTIPAIEFGKNIVDTLKMFVISFIYNIIPAIIITILFVATISAASSGGIDSANGLLVITIIVSVILGIVFGLLLTVATLRFAKTESISEAISFSQVFNEVKEIGIGKLIVFIIVLGIISGIISLVATLLSIIPIVGSFIAILIIYGFIALFESYAMGLLYSDMA